MRAALPKAILVWLRTSIKRVRKSCRRARHPQSDMWYILFSVDFSQRAYLAKVSRALPTTREQVASLASRHEQSTVRAAFFCLFGRGLFLGYLSQNIEFLLKLLCSRSSRICMG